MPKTTESRVPKKPANLSINSVFLAEARQLKINLSATLEKALEAELSAARGAVARGQQNAPERLQRVGRKEWFVC